MSKQIGIFGGSGFSREVGDIALELGLSPFYILQDEVELNLWQSPYSAITESEVYKLGNLDKKLFAIGIGENHIRKKVAEKFSAKLQFTNLIHPSASFGAKQRESFIKKNGIIICAGVRFTNNIYVGNHCIFNLNSTIGHDCIINDFVNIAPNASISGNVNIESLCWIGSGAVINQGKQDSKLTISQNTIIGSGSVVVKSCDDNSVYVGIPAQRIK